MKVRRVRVSGREALSGACSAGVSNGHHTDPGDEIDYIVDGESEWMLVGQSMHKATAADSIIIPGGPIHEARNSGTLPLKVMAVFVPVENHIRDFFRP
jgi:oxalate decarboxylase/phosphoglucose isomerase-like protein (cupin superfamily)